MSDFFEHHKGYDKYFFDDITMALNTWKTELYISLFQLVVCQAPSPRVPSVPDPSEELFPGCRTKRIARASVGFRFSDDFFGRRWSTQPPSLFPSSFPYTYVPVS